MRLFADDREKHKCDRPTRWVPPWRRLVEPRKREPVQKDRPDQGSFASSNVGLAFDFVVVGFVVGFIVIFLLGGLWLVLLLFFVGWFCGWVYCCFFCWAVLWLVLLLFFLLGGFVIVVFCWVVFVESFVVGFAVVLFCWVVLWFGFLWLGFLWLGGFSAIVGMRLLRKR